MATVSHVCATNRAHLYPDDYHLLVQLGIGTFFTTLIDKTVQLVPNIWRIWLLFVLCFQAEKPQFRLIPSHPMLSNQDRSYLQIPVSARQALPSELTMKLRISCLGIVFLSCSKACEPLSSFACSSVRILGLDLKSRNGIFGRAAIWDWRQVNRITSPKRGNGNSSRNVATASESWEPSTARSTRLNMAVFSLASRTLQSAYFITF